jgi:hypothetical protein
MQVTSPQEFVCLFSTGFDRMNLNAIILRVSFDLVIFLNNIIWLFKPKVKQGGAMKKIFLSIIFLILCGCTSRIIKFEQYSATMNLKVEADSSVFIGSDEKFSGVLWLNPILQQEKSSVTQIELIQNYGTYYVCGEKFKNVWLIEPKSDGASAGYKALDITPDDTSDVYKNIGFSRYGPKDKTCVKFKFNKHEIFIDRKGKLNEKCN